MSYILLALKRAQVDRDQAGVRGTRSSAAPRGRSLWPWLVGGGLAINALVIGAFLITTRQPSLEVVVAPPPATVEKAETPTTAELSRTEAPTEPALTQSAPTESAANEAVATAPATTNPSPAPTEAKPSPANGAASGAQQGNRRSRLPETKEGEAQGVKVPAGAPRRPDASLALVQPPTSVRPAPPAQGRSSAPEPVIVPGPPGAPDVPVDPSARRRRRAARSEPTGVPEPARPSPTDRSGSEMELKIEVLVWAADPKQRMVYMNGLKYVEGQKLESGAVIEQIVEDGVVLVHNGQRIRVRADPR